MIPLVRVTSDGPLSVPCDALVIGTEAKDALVAEVLSAGGPKLAEQQRMLKECRPGYAKYLSVGVGAASSVVQVTGPDSEMSGDAGAAVLECGYKMALTVCDVMHAESVTVVPVLDGGRGLVESCHALTRALEGSELFFVRRVLVACGSSVEEAYSAMEGVVTRAGAVDVRVDTRAERQELSALLSELKVSRQDIALALSYLVDDAAGAADVEFDAQAVRQELGALLSELKVGERGAKLAMSYLV